MDTKRKTIYAISIALVFGLIVTLIASANPDFSVEVPDRYGYARADLNDGAIVEYIGDYNVSYGSSGSGVFDPFVRLQGNEKKTDFESGYNTDAKKPEFDTKSGVWTHAILLSEIPVVEFEGTLFWEFWSDINDSDSTPLISLDDFELYLTDDPELLGYLGEGVGFGAFADEIYDFDDFNNGEHILINDVNQGSGRGDLRYLVPADDSVAENCNYGNPACTTYIVLYSEWGGVGDPYGFDGGFEEWKVKLYPKLQVSKDIFGSYETPVSWDITKEFDGTYTGFAGDSWPHGYEVSVDPIFGAPENTMVYGTITIIGDEDTAVDATITDKFDGVEATITGCSVPENPDGTFTIAAGAVVTCDYQLGLDAPDDGTNIARATFEVDGVKLAFEGSADILAGDFLEILTGNPDIDVVDTNDEAWSASAASETWTYTRDFACPTDPSAYENGSHSFTHINTATISQTGQFDNATVTVNCSLQPLEPTKTAAGEWDRTVEWTLEKSVDPASHSGFAGEVAGSSTWTVVATKNDSGPFNHHVSGTISIFNPAAIAQDFSVSDELGDGTGAAVTCDMYTIPAGGTATCEYDAYPTDDSATLNTATISATGNADQYATAEFGWSENLTGYDEGNLIDVRFGYDEIIGGTTTLNVPEEFSCPADASLYVDGFYSFTEPNTATLNGNIGLSASAEVTVDCTLQPLEPTKTAAGEWDRTVEWTLEKSVDPASHSGYAGEVAGSSTWEVVATKIDSGPFNHHVSGTISIFNPAAIAQDFSVSDELGDGTGAAVTCDMYTIPAGGTATCEYDAYPADDSATLNTATISATGNPDQIATAEFGWSENLTGYDEGNLIDGRFGYDEIIGGTTTLNVLEEFSCPADASLYVDGFYSFTEPNTATLNGNIGLSASAEVTVDCTLLPLEPTKTAAGEWDRTVEWTLEKSVDPSSHSGYAGESFVSIWTVVATKIDSGPFNHHVSGTISIFNPAAIAQDFSVSDVLDDGTGAAVTCDMYTIPAGGTATCEYDAYPADDSASLNTATISATGNPDQSATAGIGWTENLTGYDEGTLSDPRFGYVELIGDTTTRTFEETFTCSTNIEDYINGSYSYTEENWAYLNGNINLSASATVLVDCTLVIEYETAYAFGGDLAACFRDLGESRWGWVNGPIVPGEYTWPVYAGAGGCDPNDGTYVGDVTVTYDGEDVFVEWSLVEPNVLDAEHIYAGYTQIPPEGFAPGQLEIHSPFDGSPIYIIVHGVVGIPQIP